jgi:D-alanyl-D-alanine carboxypeptidase (penicillin-binding protein 5/6)
MKTNRKYLNVILLFFILLMQTYSAKDDNLYISEGSQTEATSGATESSDDTIDSIIDETNNEITGNEGGTVPSETNSDIESIINAELEKTKLDPTQGVTPKVDGAETQKSKIDPKKPLQYAVDREKEGLSKYKEGLLKFVATKEGYVLDKNLENKVHPIASLTKVMNILVTLDEVEKGNVSLEDNVCFNPQTTNIGGSWLNVKIGDCYKLKDLLRSEIIYSANNSAYLVAYHVGKGDIETFVKKMNQKAKDLGMLNTKFYTPAGLPTSMTGKNFDISTASDLYIMAKAAISNNNIREWASEPDLVFLNSHNVQIVYKSRNKLLNRYGIYGLKTGFHEQAGYNMIVASKQGNIEVISVILGANTEAQRISEQLKEFRALSSRMKLVYSKGKNMGQFNLKYAVKRKIDGVLSDKIYEIVGNNYEYKIKDLKIKTVVKKGTVIGKLETLKDGNLVSTVDILATEDVKELGWFRKFLRIISFGII